MIKRVSFLVKPQAEERETVLINLNEWVIHVFYAYYTGCLKSGMLQISIQTTDFILLKVWVRLAIIQSCQLFQFKPNILYITLDFKRLIKINSMIYDFITLFEGSILKIFL